MTSLALFCWSSVLELHIWITMTKTPNRKNRKGNRQKAVQDHIESVSEQVRWGEGAAGAAIHSIGGNKLSCKEHRREPGCQMTFKVPPLLTCFLFPGPMSFKGAWPSKKCQELWSEGSKRDLWGTLQSQTITASCTISLEASHKETDLTQGH